MEAAPKTAPQAPEAEGADLPPALVGRIGFLLGRAHMKGRELGNKALEPLELEVKQYGALAVLASEGALSQQALGERLGCDRTTMVALMDDLERKGHTKRRRNPDDRRAYALELTPSGRSILGRANRRLDAAEQSIFAALSPDERATLRELLIRLIGSA